MLIGINIRNKEIFAVNSFAKENTITSIIMILKVSVTLKIFIEND